MDPLPAPPPDEPPMDPPLLPPPVAPLPPVLEPPLEPPIEPPEPPVLLPEVVSRLLPETPAAPEELPDRLDLRFLWVPVSELEDEEGLAEVSYPPPVEPDDPPDVDEPAAPLVCATALPASDKAPRRSKVIEVLLCFMMILQTNS